MSCHNLIHCGNEFRNSDPVWTLGVWIDVQGTTIMPRAAVKAMLNTGIVVEFSRTYFDGRLMFDIRVQ